MRIARLEMTFQQIRAHDLFERKFIALAQSDAVIVRVAEIFQTRYRGRFKLGFVGKAEDGHCYTTS